MVKKKDKITAVADKNAESPIVVVGEDDSLPKKVKAKTPPKPSKRKTPVNEPEVYKGGSLGIYEDVKKDKVLDLYVAPTTIWTVNAAVAALDAHERGAFSTSGRLADNMLRDPRIGSVMDTRVLGVLGLPFEWKFDKQPTPEDMGALEILQNSWHHMFLDSVAAQVLRNTILMGVSIVNLYWETVDGYFIPQLTVWHPANSYYNIGSRKLNAFTYNQSVVELNKGDHRWMVFKLLDHERPWMSGAIRRLAFSYLARTYAMNDWRTNSTVYGNPIRKLMSTMEAAAQPDTFSFIADLAERLRMGAPVMLPYGFDLQQLESTQHSPEMFKLLIDKCDTDIAISVLGQNLTTDSTQGNGSYALGSVHAKVLQDYLEADVSMLQKTIYQQLLVPFYQFNFDSSVQVPHPHWNQVPPEDIGEISKGLLARAQSLVQLTTALQGLQSVGLLNQINLTDMFREFRLPLNTEYNTPTISE